MPSRAELGENIVRSASVFLSSTPCLEETRAARFYCRMSTTSSYSSTSSSTDSSTTTAIYAVIGFAGGLLLTCSQLPQIYRVHKRRLTYDISYGYQVRACVCVIYIEQMIPPIYTQRNNQVSWDMGHGTPRPGSMRDDEPRSHKYMTDVHVAKSTKKLFGFFAMIMPTVMSGS